MFLLRCTVIGLLENYDVELPKDLKTKIAKYVAFPLKTGNNPPLKTGNNPWEKPVDQLQCIPFSEPSRKREACPVKLVKVCRKVTLRILQDLNSDLSSGLKPISQFMEALVHFHFNPSELFITYTKYVSKLPTLINCGHGIERLGTVLSETHKLLLKVMSGSATYQEVTANGALKLESLDIEVELEGVLIFVGKNKEDVKESLSALKSLLKLFQFPKTFDTIKTLCEQLSLQNCVEDSQLNELQEIAEKLASDEQKAVITTTEAKKLWNRVERILGDTRNLMRLFLKVLENVDFFFFLRDHHFLGENGEQYFREKVQLITAQLQHEEYNDTVLNHLLAAYRYFSIFANSEQSFSNLLTLVSGLELSANTDLSQLDTAKTNMHLVHFWFTASGVSAV